MPNNPNGSLQGICEEKIVENCRECKAEIYEGQLVTSMSGTLFCNDQCLFDYLGAVMITAVEN